MAEAPHKSARGFAHFDPIPSEYGGTIRAYESSSAMGPHVWVRTVCPFDLNDPEGPTTEAVAHLSLENVERLRDHLTWLIENHYQVVA